MNRPTYEQLEQERDELAAQVGRLRELSLRLCDAVENNDELPPIKYALKCGRLVNQTRKAAQEQDK